MLSGRPITLETVANWMNNSEITKKNIRKVIISFMHKKILFSLFLGLEKNDKSVAKGEKPAHKHAKFIIESTNKKNVKSTL